MYKSALHMYFAALYKMYEVLLLALLFLGADSSSIDVQKNITAQGYPAETHHVTTKDGYILEMHRIPYGKSGNGENKRMVVFLMPSILAGSNSFIYNGPETGIAFNLADAGFDVWMGNPRGNRYSRRHISLDPDSNKEQFWDFSYEEIGMIDLPAMIDYILVKTNSSQLHYCGHTMGGTVYFVLNSRTSNYHSKFASVHLMAGIGYEEYFPQKVIQLFSAGIDAYYSGLKLTGTYEFFPSPALTKVIGGVINISIPYELVAGASTRQLIHFGQNFRDKSFCSWNYSLSNFAKYGSLVPPKYDLSKIPNKVYMYYARNDTLQGTMDVLNMVRTLQNAKVHRIARDDFNHMDYLGSDDVKPLVTDVIIRAIKNE